MISESATSNILITQFIFLEFYISSVSALNPKAGKKSVRNFLENEQKIVSFFIFFCEGGIVVFHPTHVKLTMAKYNLYV